MAFDFHENKPCDSCGSQCYLRPINGDCSYTEGKIFCSLDCMWKLRWKEKFKLYPTFQKPVLQPAPSNE